MMQLSGYNKQFGWQIIRDNDPVEQQGIYVSSTVGDQGCISLGQILIRILNPKTDFLFLWQNPKRDYESNESVRDEDSMD